MPYLSYPEVPVPQSREEIARCRRRSRRGAAALWAVAAVLAAGAVMFAMESNPDSDSDVTATACAMGIAISLAVGASRPWRWYRPVDAMESAWLAGVFQRQPDLAIYREKVATLDREFVRHDVMRLAAFEKAFRRWHQSQDRTVPVAEL